MCRKYHLNSILKFATQDPEASGETGEPEEGGDEAAGRAHQGPRGQARSGGAEHGLLEALDGAGDTAPRGEAVRARRRVGLHRGSDLQPGTDSLVKCIGLEFEFGKI